MIPPTLPPAECEQIDLVEEPDLVAAWFSLAAIGLTIFGLGFGAGCAFALAKLA